MVEKPQQKRKHRLDTIVMAIGEVTVAWAHLEIAVDLCIEVIHQDCGGKKMGIEIPRTSFYRKMDYLRQCNGRFFAFPIMFPDLNSEIIPILEDAAEQRNHIIHGAAINFNDYPETGVLRLYRRDRTKKQTRNIEGITTLKALRAFRNHILRTAMFISNFHGILTDLAVKHEGDEPLGKLLG